jgi:hypothetical protein
MRAVLRVRNETNENDKANEDVDGGRRCDDTLDRDEVARPIQLTTNVLVVGVVRRQPHKQ